MNSPDYSLINAQAYEIDRLNNEVKRLLATNLNLLDDISRIRPAHDFYVMLETAAMENEAVNNAFQQLLLLVKMSDGQTPERYVYQR